MPIEVVIKDEEIAIYIDRKRMLGWLRDVPGALDGESPIPWDGAKNPEELQAEVDKKAEELRILHEKHEGYKTGDGKTKEFPNPVDKCNGHCDPPCNQCVSVEMPDPNGEEADDAPVPVPGSINLFEEGPTGMGGTLQDDAKGKEKMKALKDWLKAEKFNYKNFCIYLYQIKEVAGFKLSTPLIGLTQKKEPSMFQLAARFHSYWMASKDDIAKDYKTFLIAQLADMGITIQMVKDEFDGKEIDPKNLPKGIKVSV
jgi:hypothetical protein